MQAAGSEQELPTWPKWSTPEVTRENQILWDRLKKESESIECIQSNWEIESESMGCVQSKQNKRQGLFQQQEEILTHGNNNKDDSEKVNFSTC